MIQQKINPLLNPLITIVAFIGLAYFLAFQKAIIIPIVIAFFFALFLLPAVRKLEKHHFPRILANLLMIICSIIVLTGIATAIGFAFSQFIGNIPSARPAIDANITALQHTVENISGLSISDQKIWIDENINLLELGAQNAGTILSQAGTIGTTLGLIFIYTFFILYYRDKMKVFLEKLLGGERERTIMEVLRKVGKLIPNYLIGVFWVMVTLSILITLGLWIAGVNNPLFWGIIIAVLNVIPYVGTFIGFLGLILFTLATQGIPFVIGAIIIFAITQFVDNNFLTPTIAGGNIDINPLAAIVGLIAVGAMWGVVGLVLAIPIIGIIKVVADSHPDYQAWGYLLGNQGTEGHAITWKSFTRRFKKNNLPS